MPRSGRAEAKAGNDDPIPTGTFVSLGYGGSITLGFETATCIRPGAALTIEVREITKEPYPAETAEVSVSADGVNYVVAGTISRDATLPVPAGVTEVRYVRLVDHSDASMLTTKGAADDGFDIDGVQVVDTVGLRPAGPETDDDDVLGHVLDELEGGQEVARQADGGVQPGVPRQDVPAQVAARRREAAGRQQQGARPRGGVRRC